MDCLIFRSFRVDELSRKENTPIIVANTHWDLPENLIRYVQEERMTTALIDMATPLSPEESIGYAECVAYLMPATQQAVLRSDVTKIYLYCVTQLMKNRKMLDALPKECKVENLPGYQMQKLNDFKRWIYKQRGGKEKNPVIDALREVFKGEKGKGAKR